MLDCLHGIASPPLSSPKDVLSSRVCVPLLQLCSTLCNPMDSSLPDPSVHGILQARILEWVAVLFSGGSSRPRNRTHISGISGIADRFFTH